MCVFGSKQAPVKNIVPQPTAAPEEPPKPVEIDKDGSDVKRRRRNPLRVDLASSAGAANTGVNV